MFELFIAAFVPLFLIVDPIGLLPMFIAITQGYEPRERRLIALRAVGIGLGLMALFAIAGEEVLTFVGISMPAFRIAGGLLLFLTAVEMLFEKRSKRREEQSVTEMNDPSVFPLATPLFAGPGSLATVILIASAPPQEIPSYVIALLAAGAVSIIALALFWIAPQMERLLGKTGINVITRLLGMILAALSVQFILDGLKNSGLW